MPLPQITLTPEQAAEFPTDSLQAFAKAYLDYQRSSPCTAKKSRYAYFTAPKAEDMCEDYVLFGPDREQAHAALMRAFRACRQRMDFDRYFDEKHAQYFESKSIPGLVVTKEMLAGMNLLPPGVYTGNYYKEKGSLAKYAEAWICMRSAPKDIHDTFGNIRLIPELSPSKDLFLWFRREKANGTWDKQKFDTVFAPRFLQEMLQDEPMKILRQLERESRTKPVAVLCTCYDENLCHRSLVKMIIDRMRPEGYTIGDQSHV